MTRVLFVDDEPKVLRGLQRMFYDVECDWETAFAQSSREALTLLAKQAFDVVVSDMRMPEMDGAALLNEVKLRHPNVIRIVLSGHSDRELVIKSVGVAHRYLAKPCNSEDLRNVVMRAIALRQILTNSSLRSLISELSQIPSAPQHYRDIMLQVRASNKSLRELGEIIAQDIGMTAKILQIVNSAFFGLPRHVSDPVHAVCLLGLEVLEVLILTAHIFAETVTDKVDGLGIEALWNHSTETGAIAKCIASAENCEPQVRDHALIAGLLHDIGKLILAVNRSSQYREAIGLSAKGTTTFLEAERQVFGTTHAEAGAYLLGLWGLPEATVEAVAFHHRPADCLATTFTPVTAVHVADAMVHAQHETEETSGMQRLDTEHLARIGLAQRLPVWQNQCLVGANR